MSGLCWSVQLKALDLHAAGGCISTGRDMQAVVLKAVGGMFGGLQLPSLGRLDPTVLLWWPVLDKLSAELAIPEHSAVSCCFLHLGGDNSALFCRSFARSP